MYVYQDKKAPLAAAANEKGSKKHKVDPSPVGEKKPGDASMSGHSSEEKTGTALEGAGKGHTNAVRSGTDRGDLQQAATVAPEGTKKGESQARGDMVDKSKVIDAPTQ